MEMLLQNVADTVMAQAMKIQTTLYDLVATLNAELSPDEDNVVIATVAHLLNTHRVTCTGALQGYRLVCHDGARSAQLPPQGYGARRASTVVGQTKGHTWHLPLALDSLLSPSSLGTVPSLSTADHLWFMTVIPAQEGLCCADCCRPPPA